MQPGIIQSLKIVEKVNSGFYLSDDSGERVFISNVFTDTQWEIGQDVEVFVFQEDGDLKATTERPYAEVGEYAVLKCIQTLPSGAFLDWGVIKDLFVPYKEQKGKMVEGKRYLVHIYEDETTGLITSTAKFKRNMAYPDFPLEVGTKVDLILMNQTEIGWNVVINQKYLGLVYASEVYKDLYPLSEQKGYIKSIREDGKIDVSLQPQGYENIDAFKQAILDKLEENYGLLYLSDKSSPEEIKEELQMSKKNFKKALGGLYKDKIVDITEDRITLL